MQPVSKFKSLSKQCGVLALAAIGMLIGADAFGQNLDEGKSALRLYADSCVTCHRSPRGLAKGRYRVTLFMFLKDHYASNSTAAWQLAAYLSSLDTPQRGKSQKATAKSSARGSSTRPPLPVQQQ
jgi:cytochrome c